MSTIILAIALAYVIAQVMKGSAPARIMEFIGLTQKSLKKQGARGTAHSIIDGLFDSSAAIGSFAKSKASHAGSWGSRKVAGLRPADYTFDSEAGELHLHLTKQDDLVIGRNASGVYAYTVSLTGTTCDLTQREFERRVNFMRRRGKLSAEQERALKDFLMMRGRRG